MFCSNLARKVPYNYILLFIFTLAESYAVGFICSITELNNINCSFNDIRISYCSNSIYKRDFTMLGGIMTKSLLILEN